MVLIIIIEKIILSRLSFKDNVFKNLIKKYLELENMEPNINVNESNEII